MGEISWYAMPVEEALKQLESSPKGLSQDEAAVACSGSAQIRCGRRSA